MDLTPLLRAYASYRYKKLIRLDPVSTQETTLLRLLKKSQSTKFGLDHGFSGIQSVTDFQKQVPLRSYESVWEEYLKPAFPLAKDILWPGLNPFFAVSSGTSSGTTKYIPISDEMIASNSKAGLDIFVHHLTQKPNSRVFGGANLIIGGSTVFEKVAPGVFSGDLSGIAYARLPWWAKQRAFPPPKIALLSDWEDKISQMAELGLQKDIRLISGVPSWMLIFFDSFKKFSKKYDGTLKSVFPNLECIVHGGVSFAPYKKSFENLLQGSHAELREVYPASEGFVAVADRGSGEGMRLNLDNDIFFEFVPLEELESKTPIRHWVKTIERDVNYAVVLSSCAGLFSYILGDTVRFVDTKTPRLLVTGRTAYTMNAFGEHLILEEVEYAVMKAASACNFTINDYAVGALFPEETGSLGQHLFFIECSNPQAESLKATFLKVLDEALKEKNDDFKAHRADGFGLNPPTVSWVPIGSFAEWMKSRGKLGGQHKVPRLIAKHELFQSLKNFMQSH